MVGESNMSSPRNTDQRFTSSAQSGTNTKPVLESFQNSMVSPTTPQTVAWKHSTVVAEDVNLVEYSTDNDKQDADTSRDLIKFNEV